MGVGHEKGEPSGLDAYGQAAEFRLILAVAEALRREFGDFIDAHPGGEGTEAGVVNRAFRATARQILMTIVTPGDDLGAVLSWVLRQAARRRLAEAGLDGGLTGTLLGSEPSLGDRWPAYLALAPATVIGDMLVGPEGE